MSCRSGGNGENATKDDGRQDGTFTYQDDARRASIKQWNWSLSSEAI